MRHITYLLLISILVQGCTSTRYSYTKQLVKHDNVSELHLQKGDMTELLAVGNGFPGWWGYYPWVISSSPSTASIDCKETRSAIPFRAPGVIFGGIVCTLVAHEEGKMTLYFGNEYTLSEDHYEENVNVVIVE